MLLILQDFFSSHCELVLPTDISHYRLLFQFFLQYTDCVPFELVESAALLYEETAAVEGNK
jgi:hypothetical protein